MTANKDKPSQPTGNSQSGTGLTKREYAAIHILAGLYANPECMDYTTLEGTAVAAADKLFAELEKPEP